MVMRARSLVVVVAVAACGRFQDPNTVVDLRVISMTAEPPDQMVDVDLANPNPSPTDLLAQLVPAKVCALVTDPNFTRRLRWSMNVCNLGNDGRCTDPQYSIFSGDGSCSSQPCIVDDMDTTVPEPHLCATIPADENLLGVLIPIVQADVFHGLGGIEYGIQLVVGGEGADQTLDLYSGKQLMVSPHIPVSRTANHNPFLRPDEPLDASVDGGTFLPMPMGRCVDQIAAGNTQLVVPPGKKVRLFPVEGDGARETYTVPTLDGRTETFTEALTYQWLAGNGSFSSGGTGGPHDEFGNPAPLFTDWTAPAAKDLKGPTDISVWVVQRDERLGEAWYETCIHVAP
jgi:hypothetical protein